jgi:1-acyl-sn-glycerol-3-phosphate acyltransferase
LAIAITAFYSIFGVVGSYLAGAKARDFQNWVLITWGNSLMKIFSVKVVVVGEENLAPEGVLFVFNHTSLFDIPIFHSVVTKPTRFGAKIELYKVPFFGQAMTKFGALPISRSDRDKVLKLYQDSIERVHRGESFILAGEGGRHKGVGVGEKFKSGPFIFAINGQFPIQPLVIEGASDLLPNRAILPSWGRWHNTVTVRILPAVPTRGLTTDDRDELKTSVHEMMTKAHARS